MPINIVAGFFGMNVGGIPFAENHHGFWVYGRARGLLHGTGGMVGVSSKEGTIAA